MLHKMILILCCPEAGDKKNFFNKRNLLLTESKNTLEKTFIFFFLLYSLFESCPLRFP